MKHKLEVCFYNEAQDKFVRLKCDEVCREVPDSGLGTLAESMQIGRLQFKTDKGTLVGQCEPTSLDWIRIVQVDGRRWT